MVRGALTLACLLFVLLGAGARADESSSARSSSLSASTGLWKGDGALGLRAGAIPPGPAAEPVVSLHQLYQVHFPFVNGEPVLVQREWRGEWLEMGSAFTRTYWPERLMDDPSAERSQLAVQFPQGIFGYGQRYRLSLQDRELARFRTEAQPAQQAGSAWRWGAIPTGDAARLRAAFQAGRPSARQLGRVMDGLIHVHSHAGGHASYGGWETIGARRRWMLDMNSRHLHTPGLDRHVFWHELGHVVDMAGISQRAMRSFFFRFLQSPAWRGCFSYRGSCVSHQEIFAEQFALWANRGRKTQAGYRIPQLISSRQFSQLLERWWGGGAPADLRPRRPRAESQ